MAYSKQNFQDGQILNAAQLEKMENGIIAGQGAKNLLVNSDFRNPINSKNQTSYSGSMTSSIDKWCLLRGTPNSIVSLKISDNGIILSKSGDVSSFSQSLSIDISNKQITYAIKTSEGITLGTCIASATANYIRIGTHTGYLSTVSGNGITTFSIYFNDPTSDSITLEWAALYEGSYTVDTLPDYIPKTIQQEMIDCGVSLSPRNLLDNSDFTNYVNQRGGGSTAGVWNYCIDRWRAIGTAGQLVWHDTNYVALGALRGINQAIENKSRFVGKTYTIAAKDVDGVLYITSGTYGGDNQHIWKETNGMELRLYSVSDDSNIYYSLKNLSSDTSKFIFLVWAALYEGSYTADTLPAYVPKGYGAELAECQRYYIHDMGRFTQGIVMPNGWLRVSYPVPTTMRTNPTVIVNSLDNAVIYSNGYSTVIGLTACSFFDKKDNAILVDFSTTINEGDYRYCVATTHSTSISFSADL